jgi:hypothetical protein
MFMKTTAHYLGSICDLSQKTVRDTLSQLATTDYIDAQLMPPTSFKNRMQTVIDTFERRTPSLLLRILDLIREITAANQLMSMYSTNWKYIDANVEQIIALLHTVPLEYQECTCGLSSKCTQSSRGMKAGCYPLESLLQSTLQCFYNQQCIDPNANFKALDSSSVHSRFATNSTIEDILNKLMVEEYSKNISYEN